MLTDDKVRSTPGSGSGPSQCSRMNQFQEFCRRRRTLQGCTEYTEAVWAPVTVYTQQNVVKTAWESAVEQFSSIVSYSKRFADQSWHPAAPIRGLMDNINHQTGLTVRTTSGLKIDPFRCWVAYDIGSGKWLTHWWKCLMQCVHTQPSVFYRQVREAGHCALQRDNVKTALFETPGPFQRLQSVILMNSNDRCFNYFVHLIYSNKDRLNT